jgi:hypothetical protein
MEMGRVVPTIDSESVTCLYHREKPFEFFHLGCRKKLTLEELGP